MFPLGHASGTLLAWRLQGDRWAPLPDLPWIWLVVAAGLPDIVDKPLGLLVLGLGRGRLVGHSLAFAAGLALLATALRAQGRRAAGGRVGLLAFGSGVHLLLDRMYMDPHTLLWPLLGVGFPARGFEPASWWGVLLTDPWTYAPEALGAAYLAWEVLSWAASHRAAA